MAEWDEIAKANLSAAQRLTDGAHARSCVSRSYYAAFAAVAFTLRSLAPFGMGRETPPHHRVTRLIHDHLGESMGPRRLRELQAMVRRLYNERLNADYRARLTVDGGSALQARRDAHAVCRELGVL